MPPRRKSAKTADPTNDVETQQSTPSFADSLEQRRRAPSSSFHSFRLQLRDSLQQLTTSMQARRESGATDAPSEDDVVQAVEQIVNSLGRPLPASEEEQWRRDARKTAIDRCLEEMIMNWVSSAESQSEPLYYAVLADLLDILLTFSEREYADDTLPFNVMNNLLELQTITGCQHLFNYIESRRKRLTKGMLPMRGKGPLLLRLSNELLRRLPKTKQEHVVFSGRVLMFLNSVFPLGEKSGVNLRGNFNIGKTTTFEEPAQKDAVMEADLESGEEKSEIGIDSSQFYTTFWSLQKVFTNPPLLFTPTSTSSAPDPWFQLQAGLKQTLTTFASVTKKERELSGGQHDGSGGNTGKQKAREAVSEDEDLEDYFFPKFLTSEKLLDLELADPFFRRQILVQMLILFQYLLSFVPSERARVLEFTTNVAALPNYTLSAGNEKWIRDLREKVLDEMDSMDGGGRHFRHTIELILRREKNWTDWKLRGCPPFEKPSIDASAKSDVARSKLKVLARQPKSYMHQLGNPILSRAWQKNTPTLDGFEPMEIVDDSDSLARSYKMASKQLAMRKAALAQAQEAQAAQKVAELTNDIENLSIKVDALHWRAIRAASATYLHLFVNIGAGDIDLLLTEIEKDRKAAEEREEARIASLEQGGAGAEASEAQTDADAGEAVEVGDIVDVGDDATNEEKVNDEKDAQDDEPVEKDEGLAIEMDTVKDDVTTETKVEAVDDIPAPVRALLEAGGFASTAPADSSEGTLEVATETDDVPLTPSKRARSSVPAEADIDMTEGEADAKKAKTNS